MSTEYFIGIGLRRHVIQICVRDGHAEIRAEQGFRNDRLEQGLVAVGAARLLAANGEGGQHRGRKPLRGKEARDNDYAVRRGVTALASTLSRPRLCSIDAPLCSDG